jgi:hypothetical protein
VNVVDAYLLTAQHTSYRPGDQAPCRSCADVRRVVTDSVVSSLISATGEPKVTIVARGLHLTDTAISALWRFAMGMDAAEDLMRSGKARPITALTETVYLARPLYYIREYESQQFAQAADYQPACCGCPACRYPSRRDIVEESLACALRGPLWEFDVPGMRTFLGQTANPAVVDEVERRSASGTETKHARLPVDFFEYAAALFKRRARTHRGLLRSLLSDPGSDNLDLIGARRLRYRVQLCRPVQLPPPALLQDTPMSEFQLRMVGTLGPYWGAIGLTPDVASRAWAIQKQVFGLEVDSHWSHVTPLLRSYYSGRSPFHETHLFHIVSSSTTISSNAFRRAGGAA